MEQLVQNLKDGKMEVVEVPFPHLPAGHILVRNHFSAISAGTEGKTVGDARKGYIAKAKSRQDEVKKVLKAVQSHGFTDTYKMVMNKLEAPSALGYSCAGEVIAVGEGVAAFKVGDRVACGGGSAVHAEVVTVPENLAVIVPENVPLNEAAFTTIASIAIQGLRRANLQFGENCVVVGLGLIGQLSMRLLSASGVRCFGVDINPELVNFAKEHGADAAMERSNPHIEEEIKRFTKNSGADAVIITAGTSSLDPVEFAGKISRVKAKVIIVGNVPTGFSRKEYYRKELDLLMSTSYGPGRYNAAYEEKGLDYPIGYVRWTENRNMQSFLDLLSSKKLSLSGMISHEFDFESAKEAYDLILSKAGNVKGIILKYNVKKELKKTVSFKGDNSITAVNAVSFIGAGSFAGNFLLPNLAEKIPLGSVLTSRANSALNAAQKFGFAKGYSSLEDMLAEDKSEAIFITTRHDTHARYAVKALNAGKRVYVEKPLCLHENELHEIEEALAISKKDLMVGFNRRFSPLTKEVLKMVGGAVCSINYRINSGNMPADHWVHDPEVGGGRILGEVCHFVDLCSFIAQSPVEAVSAMGYGQNSDTLVVNMKMQNGSVASVSYFSNGAKELPKEYLEVFSDGNSAVLDDFKKVEIFGSKPEKIKLGKQDKGHAAEMAKVAECLKKGTAFPVSIEESLASTRATFAVLESVKNSGALIKLEDYLY